MLLLPHGHRIPGRMVVHGDVIGTQLPDRNLVQNLIGPVSTAPGGAGDPASLSRLGLPARGKRRLRGLRLRKPKHRVTHVQSLSCLAYPVEGWIMRATESGFPVALGTTLRFTMRFLAFRNWKAVESVYSLDTLVSSRLVAFLVSLGILPWPA